VVLANKLNTFQDMHYTIYTSLRNETNREREERTVATMRIYHEADGSGQVLCHDGV
jgi:hypothetical protein